MDIRSVFGRNMRRHRLAAGLSQEAVAVRMGVDRAHVSSMERGQQNVTLLTIWHAAEALGVKPAMLLADDAEFAALKPPRRTASAARRRP
jgi:transcriptional regulator with XRE-family HTH domain